MRVIQGICLMCLAGCLSAAEQAPTTVEKLQREVELLRQENQYLRRALMSHKNAGALTNLPQRVIEKMPSTNAVETGYWISSRNQIRHNTSCPYYQKSRGRACQPTEGRACQACGG